MKTPSINVSSPAAIHVLRSWGFEFSTSTPELPVAPDGTRVTLAVAAAIGDQAERYARIRGRLRTGTAADIGVFAVNLAAGPQSAYVKVMNEDPSFKALVRDAVEDWLEGNQNQKKYAPRPMAVEVRTTSRYILDESQQNLTMFAVEVKRPIERSSVRTAVLILPEGAAKKLIAASSECELKTAPGPELSSLFTSERAMETTFSLWEPGSEEAYASFKTARDVAQLLEG